jgi:AhpD family alkylhydroperoxidase
MKERISFKDVPQELMGSLFSMGNYWKKSEVDKKLLELVKCRTSQLDGCAFCLDMHHKDAIHNGETEQRLHSLPAWRECPHYSDAERAALAFTDSLTTHADAEDTIFTTLASFFENKARRKLDADKQTGPLASPQMGRSCRSVTCLIRKS